MVTYIFLDKTFYAFPLVRRQDVNCLYSMCPTCYRIIVPSFHSHYREYVAYFRDFPMCYLWKQSQSNWLECHLHPMPPIYIYIYAAGRNVDRYRPQIGVPQTHPVEGEEDVCPTTSGTTSSVPSPQLRFAPTVPLRCNLQRNIS